MLGLAHGHRIEPGIHGTFAPIIFVSAIAQSVLGLYLKTHLHEKSFRPAALLVHGCLGKLFPILGWTQMLFGVITIRGYCQGGLNGQLAQCLAHYIMVDFHQLDSPL